MSACIYTGRQMSKNVLISVFWLLSLVQSVSGTEALNSFKKSQNDDYLTLMECALKLRIFNTMERSSASSRKALSDAAKCFANLKQNVSRQAEAYKIASSSRAANQLIDKWENAYSSTVDLAIKYQEDKDMPQKIGNFISDIDKEIAARIEKEETRDEYVRKVLESPLKPVD